MDEFQKIITALLKGKKLRTPFEIDADDTDYRDSLNKKLDEYIRRLGNLKDTGPISKWVKSNISNIESLNNNLLTALDEYLTGNAGIAYDKIETLMSSEIVETNIIHLKRSLDEFNNDTLNSNSLYRVRYSDAFISKREEIFHIPFDKRFLVGAQRYSIAGLPCLYLGASLYVCWQEMEKPDLNKLFLSHFKTNEKNSDDIEVLDFAYSLETLKHGYLEEFLIYDDSESIEKLQSYLAMWPILLSCSYNRKMGKSNFNVEYVIPNLILQWIGKEKRQVSGIRYFSTKTTHLRHSDIGVNYVFPPSIETPKTSGFCDKLSSTFLFSNPVSWQMLTVMTENKISNHEKFQLTDNIEELLIKKYKFTQFYIMEENLKRIMPCDSVNK